MKKSNALEMVVALAEPIPPADIRKLSEQLTFVSTQVDGVTDNLLNVAGVEKRKVKSDLVFLMREQMYLRNHVTFGSRYPLLNTDPLTLRDKHGWPRLVVFALGPKDSEIAATEFRYSPSSKSYETKLFPLPEPIAVCYTDVLEMLRREAFRKKRDLTLSYRFEGAIPSKAGKKLFRARELFRGNLFLITEPKNLAREETAVIRPSRALAIGFDGRSLWLIADFKVTPIKDGGPFFPRAA